MRFWVNEKQRLSSASPRLLALTRKNQGTLTLAAHPSATSTEYDIADLLGHTLQAVTGTYARSTPQALEEAVNKLAEPRRNVIEFKRKAS